MAGNVSALTEGVVTIVPLGIAWYMMLQEEF